MSRILLDHVVAVNSLGNTGALELTQHAHGHPTMTVKIRGLGFVYDEYDSPTMTNIVSPQTTGRVVSTAPRTVIPIAVESYGKRSLPNPQPCGCPANQYPDGKVPPPPPPQTTREWIDVQNQYKQASQMDMARMSEPARKSYLNSIDKHNSTIDAKLDRMVFNYREQCAKWQMYHCTTSVPASQDPAQVEINRRLQLQRQRELKEQLQREAGVVASGDQSAVKMPTITPVAYQSSKLRASPEALRIIGSVPMENQGKLVEFFRSQGFAGVWM